MPNKYTKLLDNLEPYIVTNAIGQIDIEQKIFGKSIKPELLIKPLSLKSKSFIEKIYHMDSLTFGHQGMGMEKWVFLDCSVMPGFVFGFAIDVNKLSRNDKKTLKVKEGDRYFPLSMYIAIPTMNSDIWFGHNLSSLNSILDQDLSGLGYLTKASALGFFKISHLQGATQWDSKAISVHLKFSPMKLLSAYTPIHSKPMSFVYESKFNIPIEDISFLNNVKKRGVEKSDLFIATDDSCKELQQKIEMNNEYYIVDKLSDPLNAFHLMSIKPHL